MGDVLRRLIAFDLDGTIIESRRDLADSANQLIQELGGRPLTVEAVEGMIGGGAALFVQRAFDAAGMAHAPGALARFLAIYDTRLLRNTVLYDGIVRAIEHARLHARVAVLTNKPLAPSERILEGLGIRQLFDDVTGGDGPHGRKPEPGGLLALMAQSGAAPGQTLLVGDSGIDVETARCAGVRCCLVTYGFGWRRPLDEIPPGVLVADRPDALLRIVDDFTAST